MKIVFLILGGACFLAGLAVCWLSHRAHAEQRNLEQAWREYLDLW